MQVLNDKPHYSIEFDGYDYYILRDQKVIVSFHNAEAAICARRNFERKSMPQGDWRIPPAMLALRQARG